MHTQFLKMLPLSLCLFACGTSENLHHPRDHGKYVLSLEVGADETLNIKIQSPRDYRCKAEIILKEEAPPSYISQTLEYPLRETKTFEISGIRADSEELAHSDACQGEKYFYNKANRLVPTGLKLSEVSDKQITWNIVKEGQRASISMASRTDHLSENGPFFQFTIDDPDQIFENQVPQERQSVAPQNLAWISATYETVQIEEAQELNSRFIQRFSNIIDSLRAEALYELPPSSTNLNYWGLGTPRLSPEEHQSTERYYYKDNPTSDPAEVVSQKFTLKSDHLKQIYEEIDQKLSLLESDVIAEWASSPHPFKRPAFILKAQNYRGVTQISKFSDIENPSGLFPWPPIAECATIGYEFEFQGPEPGLLVSQFVLK